MAIYGSLGDIEVTSTDYPSIQPTLDLNFAKTKALDPRITFYRNSLATYTDDKGIIRTVPENVPRFDHDPTTGESLGLLIEESRTNVGLYSEQFNQWTNDGVTVTTNAITAPDGTTTADLVTGVSGNRRIYLINVVSNGPVYTYSIFVKKNVGSTIRFDNINVGSTSTQFNFDTGVLTLSGTAFTSGTSTAYPNGWYRITLTYTSNGASASLGPYFVNTNDSCYMWGYQFELGSFATSYIPTTTSTVTRSADFVEMSGTNFSSWYNQSEGTIYSEHLYNSYLWHFANAFTSQTDRLFAFSDNTGGGFRVGRLTNGSFTYISPPSDGNTYARGSNIKSVCAYSGQTFLVGSFGNPLTTGTSSASNTSIDRLYFYQDSNNLAMGTTIKRFMYYPKRLTNTQLQNLTA